MKIQKVLFVFGLLLCSYNVQSQTEKPLSIKIELGGHDVTGSLSDTWNIRQDVGSYYNGAISSVTASLFITNIAAKLEYALFDSKLALSGGLQFSNLFSEIYSTNSAQTNSFFYLRYMGNGINTNYAQIKSINESSNYLSIPVDVKFIPFTFWKCDFFIRTGIDFGLLIGADTNFEFLNKDMVTEKNAIISSLDVYQNPIISSWNTSIGVRFGNRNKLHYNFEILLPSMLISKHNSSILTDQVFTGFKLSAQLPIK